MSSRQALRDPSSPTPDPPTKDTAPAAATEIPQPCGPLSDAVVQALTLTAGPAPSVPTSDLNAVRDPFTDRDFQLALWMLYELHYRGFAGAEDRQWDPALLGIRQALETTFEDALRALVAGAGDDAGRVADKKAMTAALLRLTTSRTEPALAAFLAREATADQFRAFLAERAVYHLREADAQCFLLAHLTGGAKTALAEVQYDEYGTGRPERLHAAIYTRALASLGLPTAITPHVDAAGATTFASVNTTSLLNFHRRLRGAAAGHFAAFEATSSIPCRLIADGARRLGLPEPVVDYFDEHVEADAVHERLAIDDVCGRLVTDEPALTADVLFGARVCLTVDALAAETMLTQLRRLPADDRLAS